MRRSSGRPARLLLVLVAVVLATAVVGAVLPAGYAGYDAAWSLVWGAQIADGHLPTYTADLAPTPHPLSNLLAVPLSTLRDGGEGALVRITEASFVALLAGAGAAAAAMARTDRGRPARAALVALVLLAVVVTATRGELVRGVAYASLDVPFLALVVWALALELRAPRRGPGVLALLLVAGLLRPEAWALSVAYVVWCHASFPASAVPRDPLAPTPSAARRRPRPTRSAARDATIALAAPVLWALSDLVVTGRPLWSLTGTQDLAGRLDRPTGLVRAIERLPEGVASITGTPAAVAGVVGVAVVCAAVPRSRRPVLGVLAVGAATFLALGAAGLPVLDRYLLVPSVVLLVAAAAATGLGVASAPAVRAELRARSAGRATVVGAGAALVAILLAAGAVADGHRLGEVDRFSKARGAVQRQLRGITGSPGWTAAIERCAAPILVPDFRARPIVLLDAPRVPPRRVAVGNLGDGRSGVLLTYATLRTGALFSLGTPSEAGIQAPPSPSRRLAATPAWRAYVTC